MTQVFVYGTLKSGKGNNRLLHDQRFVGRAWTRSPAIALVDLGPFPGAVRIAAATVPHRAVFGEVYRVDDAGLARLDRLESNGSFYTRELVDTSLGEAWIYLLPPTYLHRTTAVDSGVWHPTPEEAEWVASISANGGS